MKTSTGGCQVEKLPAISGSMGEKRKLTGKCKIAKVQQGKVKSWRSLEDENFNATRWLRNLLLTF